MQQQRLANRIRVKRAQLQPAGVQQGKAGNPSLAEGDSVAALLGRGAILPLNARAAHPSRHAGATVAQGVEGAASAWSTRCIIHGKKGL